MFVIYQEHGSISDFQFENNLLILTFFVHTQLIRLLYLNSRNAA